MTSRREFVISQAWASPSGLRALARIRVRQSSDPPQVADPPIDFDTSIAADDATVCQETANRP